MPSVANKNFPYHVRTTQIGVMELTGSNAIEQFNHHIYEPAGGVDQTVIIPLTRRTEEIFGGMYNQRLNCTRNSHPIEEDRHLQNGHDVTMQNVLSWSIAKNFTPIDLGVFHQIDRSCLGRILFFNYYSKTYLKQNYLFFCMLISEYYLSIGFLGSARSRSSDNSTCNHLEQSNNAPSSARTNPRPSITEPPKTTTEEWVKEVPVELFTVSKLVANTKPSSGQEHAS